MKKKSILTMALSLALVGSISVGATLAYLTSTASAVTNTFTVGNVKISQAETDWDALTAAQRILIPGSSVDKSPTVTVEAGSQNCYVFMKIDASAIDTANGTTTSEDAKAVRLNISGSWHKVLTLTKGTPDANDTTYSGYYEYYDNNGIASVGTLPALFTSVTTDATYGNNEALGKLGLSCGITISSFAIQAENLTFITAQDHLTI